MVARLGSGLLVCGTTLWTVMLTGCGEPSLAASVAPWERNFVASPRFVNGGVSQALAKRAWLDAAQLALENPKKIDLPYAVSGTFAARTPDATALSFVAIPGQIVTVGLARSDAQRAAPRGKIDIELFLVEQREDGPHNVLLDSVSSESALDYQYRLPARAKYVVRVRPEPRADTRYRMTVELEAALPFPVRGRRDGDVASFFGAARDDGTRHHEGVDIFAPRLTPVVAVADGRATPRMNHLGGNTVWLSTPGVSYYYAHLERAAIKSGQRVRAGDVLGYVGNTGNALTTEPHLHFGVYRWGKGAVDPLPMLQARRFSAAERGAAPGDIVAESRSSTSVRDDLLAPLDLAPRLPRVPIELPQEPAVASPGIVATGVVLELSLEEVGDELLCELPGNSGAGQVSDRMQAQTCARVSRRMVF